MTRLIPFLVSLLAACLSLPVAADESRPDLVNVTDGGLTVALFSQMQPLQINRIHSWRISLSDASGEPVAAADLSVDGGMVEHDHGLPTRPVVSATAVPGIYLLQGMRFHMPGQWRLTLSIVRDGHSETTHFDFSL